MKLHYLARTVSTLSFIASCLGVIASATLYDGKYQNLPKSTLMFVGFGITAIISFFFCCELKKMQKKKPEELEF